MNQNLQCIGICEGSFSDEITHNGVTEFIHETSMYCPEIHSLHHISHN